MKPYRFTDLIADGMQGAERCHGLLEDEGDTCASDGSHKSAVGVKLRYVDFAMIVSSASLTLVSVVMCSLYYLP